MVRLPHPLSFLRSRRPASRHPQKRSIHIFLLALHFAFAARLPRFSEQRSGGGKAEARDRQWRNGEGSGQTGAIRDAITQPLLLRSTYCVLP